MILDSDIALLCHKDSIVKFNQYEQSISRISANESAPPWMRLDLLVVPVRLERTVPRDPMALLQFVPEGGEDPVEGMPDYDESGRVLPTQQLPQGGVGKSRGHLLGLLIGLADKYEIL